MRWKISMVRSSAPSEPRGRRTPVDLPTLAVVIPSRNRLNRLPGLVATYLQQNADAVVVVLDGPHPDWPDVLGSLVDDRRVVVVELDPHLGLALARIAGLRAARSDVILIADDDVDPAPGLVSSHRTFHATHPRSALLGYMPVMLPQHRGRDQAATYIYARDYENQVAAWREGTSDDRLAAFWGGNASVPRTLYLEAESHKPSAPLAYNEDLDLGLRLRAIGAGADFDEAALGWHQHKRDFRSFVRECETRGEMVSALQQRWSWLPESLLTLVEIPTTHPWLARHAQKALGRRDNPGLLDAVIIGAYHLSGMLHFWRSQDAIARFMRRGLAVRGYRRARSRADAST